MLMEILRKTNKVNVEDFHSYSYFRDEHPRK